ncbi:hypothetical protein [Acanthamoeba castellanii mimivirus]|uniref:Uncharacterized protein R9 n=5 Tax=Mimivirus TaxID=315393 RepID=YR009_MIMIV|nr:hypothetical protein MIMI_gp0009 [Acanthamoeba polyphaga mimivirus]Q5UP89.1 RecName: Full=Uncharacterized protein R9 [Acanthamoeba polyphaga mimivirus]AEQ60165.1 T5orf172 domain-containing protein [Acanthamoeba castellanii mamavirus]AHA45889.1 hypothetical protein HIRU_S983 [Hirudovirus strain Sangsue]ALR83549.1 T5orf172 domain-containing protein [Niemeyer virus]AMK61701.1 replication origin-binding protein [Samba virus]AMZ02462.1 hypothetical protein [Mimivirus Bombay]EJN40529.1 hypothet
MKSKQIIAFYVITTNYHHNKKTYKIGIHTGTLEDLISRYMTYFPDLIVKYFQYTVIAREVETNLKKNLRKHRVVNIKGGRSEWINMEYEKLYAHIKCEINSDKNIIINDVTNMELVNKYTKELLINKLSRTIYQTIFDIEICKPELLAGIDESKYNLDELLTKQTLSETKSLALKKMLFMKTFGITDSSHQEEFIEFYNEYASKIVIIRRFERFFSYDKQYNEIDYNLNHHNDGKDKLRDKIILEFINFILGKNKTNYKSDSLSYILSQDEHNTAVLTVAEQSMYFANEDKFRPLFNKNKGKFKEINEFNFKHYFETVQAILRSYGIDYCRGKRKRINGGREFEYSLSVNKQIRDIIDFKYGLSDSVNDFPNLFHK